MVDKGLFGGFFDWNLDGKLDPFEQAADMAAFMLLMDDIKRPYIEDPCDDSLDYDLSDNSDDDESF